jgi:putative membrane protein
MTWLLWFVPWQPSPTVVVTTLLFAALYVRGGRRRPQSWPRQLAFWAGLAVIYLALHSRLDYYAQREFFMRQIQQALLRMGGPFLLALAQPGRALLAGVPDAWRRRWVAPALASRPVQAALGLLLHPVVNGLLYLGVGLIWLLPVVDFYAGLDVRLYRLMNWSITLDGLLFWFLALDPRPAPPARLGPGARVLLLGAVMPPQMVVGAAIALTGRNLYPIYELCGRAFANLGFHDDQVLGGLILWLPSTMMHMLGALIVMYFWYLMSEHPDRLPSGGDAAPPAGDKNAPAPKAL